MSEAVPNTEFFYLFGVSLTRLAAGCEQGEFPGPDPDNVLDQQVFRPDGSVKQILRMKNVPIIVWNEGEVEDFCAAPPPFAVGIALGIAQSTGTGNDLLSGPRTESQNFRIDGTVTALEGGQRYRLQRKFHFVQLKSGEVRLDRQDWKFFPVGP